MRDADLEDLSRDYSEPNIPPEHRLASALGVATPGMLVLARELAADLDHVAYGIGWWAPHPGTSRRILVSDYLIQCAGGIPRNVIEAKLHFLDLLDWWECEDRFLRDSVKIEHRRLKIKLPRRLKPLDDLPASMFGLHSAGFFRSVNSALDCLGAVIIGVAALPARILRAGFRDAFDALEEADETAESEGERLQGWLCNRVVEEIERSGPPGWLEWTLRFRNMLTHRARRIQFTQLRPEPVVLFGADGHPILRTEAIRHLSRDPDLSDVEALLAGNRAELVLSEAASLTLAGVLQSIVHLIDAVAGLLLEVWTRRRTEPGLLLQPREQWPGGVARREGAFRGYAPDSVAVDPGLFLTAPDVVRRLNAAVLGDRNRHLWAGFD
jgi:hypothetical protein